MQTKLIVTNIKCGGCEASIKAKLSKIEGVSEVSVDSTQGQVVFESESTEEIDKVRRTLSAMGYPEGNSNTLQKAKSYVNCMIGRISK